MVQFLAGIERYRLPDALARLRARRPDQALLLAVTEEAAGPDPTARLVELTDQLMDDTWVAKPAARAANHDSVGVLSLGDGTRAVLEAAEAVSGRLSTLLTDQRAVAAGLSYLSFTIVPSPAEEAPLLLLPGVAVHQGRVWTSAFAAKAAERAAGRGAEIEIVAHPLAHLSKQNRKEFRPGAGVTDWKP